MDDDDCTKEQFVKCVLATDGNCGKCFACAPVDDPFFNVDSLTFYVILI